MGKGGSAEPATQHLDELVVAPMLQARAARVPLNGLLETVKCVLFLPMQT